MAANAIQYQAAGPHHMALPANLFTAYNAPAGSIHTEPEGRNTRAFVHPQEQRVIREPGHTNHMGAPSQNYDGYTFQRLPPGTPHVPAAELAQSRNNPNFRIPMTWWQTFLPRQRFARINAAGNPIPHGLNAAGNRQNEGPHMAALEALGPTIQAPTKRKIVDHTDPNPATRDHPVTANARPQLLYPRTNTEDRPANEKHCAYGKIRDPETNSWRCVRNPNHHRGNL
jgi:hypothetical protein